MAVTKSVWSKNWSSEQRHVLGSDLLEILKIAFEVDVKHVVLDDFALGYVAFQTVSVCLSHDLTNIRVYSPLMTSECEVIEISFTHVNFEFLK